MYRPDAINHFNDAHDFLELAKTTGHDFYRVSSAIETMQICRKRKLMIDDDMLDAYLAEDSECLPEVWKC